MKRHSAYVYLGIEGDFDPADFAGIVPLEPDESLAKHSRDLERKIPRTSLLRYGQVETFLDLIDIYDLAERSFGIVGPHLDSFARAIRIHNAEVLFQVVLYFPRSDEIGTPAMGFPRELISFLAAVGASVDIDTY